MVIKLILANYNRIFTLISRNIVNFANDLKKIWQTKAMIRKEI